MSSLYVKHEYMITEDHRDELRQTLTRLQRDLQDHCRGQPEVTAAAPFDFNWPTGLLRATVRVPIGEIEEALSSQFEDAPIYRVTPGVNSRILGGLIDDLLMKPSEEFAMIRSLMWSGKTVEGANGNVINVEHLQVAESSIPVEIETSNPVRATSPLGEWGNIRIGGISFWGRRNRIRQMSDGPLVGDAHLVQEKTWFRIDHQTWDSERLIFYPFDFEGSIFRVLDPAAPAGSLERVELEGLCIMVILIGLLALVFLSSNGAFGADPEL